MATQRRRASVSGPAVPALLAWTGFDRATSSSPARGAAFSAALTGAGARSGHGRHARHCAADRTGGGRAALLGPARARHITAGLVVVCGSVLAAAVTVTDGTLGPSDGLALPEFAPGKPAPGAPPGGRALVETAAVSRPVSTALAAGAGTARPSPDAAAGTAAAHPAGAAPSRSSGSTSAAQPEPPGADAATDSTRPLDGASDEDRPSPVDKVTEPVDPVTEPVDPVTEPVDPVTEPVEGAGQSAMSMLDQPLP